MESALTEEVFNGLLYRLDADREQAGEKYEALRRMLLRFFEWRGAPFPEEQTDETLNRLAKKLKEGVDVKDIHRYCYEIARLVFLEALKGNDSRSNSLEELQVEAAAGTDTEVIEKEIRLACLDDCLCTLSDDSRQLIVEYYRDAKRQRIDHRKALAARLGLSREALANRAQRLRDKLQHCVARCVAKKSAI